MDLRRLSVLLFIPALLLAQSRPSVRPVTEEVQFLFFFLRLGSDESRANAEGASDSRTKRALKDTVRLTDTEISLVREVALSCKASYDAKTRSGGTEVRQLAAQNSRNAPPPDVSARIDALERERTKVITDCLDSLKRGMGAARYGKLENYVRAKGAAIRYVNPSELDPNARTTQPPGGLKRS